MHTSELGLTPGRVYRTRDLEAFSSNPTRWAGRMVRAGGLRRLAHGLYHRPRIGGFGPVPPEDREVLRAFLGDDRFLITGPPVWNALGLGATAVFPIHLVYNQRRSGTFRLGRQRYWLRRVRYPDPPPLEWFVVDLFENADSVGADPRELESALESKLRDGTFDPGILVAMAREHGTAKTLGAVERTVHAVSARR